MKNPKLANSVSQLQMVNYQMPGNTPALIPNSTSSQQYVLSGVPNKPISSRGKSGGTGQGGQTNVSSQSKRASDWKKPQMQMMPSQMSINDAKSLAHTQSQEATA